MAGENQRPGRLIAVDGTRGKDVAAAAEALAAALRRRDVSCGISRWDASGLFTDLIAADPSLAAHRSITPRTITLIYAADLVFRLRWEIGPALASGGIVIAAPYVETAVAVGLAGGLSERWVREILRFATPASINALARERRSSRGWPKKPRRGYAEFSAALLAAGPRGLKSRKARQAAIAWLADHAGKDVTELSKRGIAELVKSLE